MELVKDDGSGGTQVVAHYEYDPFGRLTQDDDTDSSGYHAINPFKFSTKYHDAETGFYYYGYRFYDPVTGRWSSRDPIGEKGGLNVYSIVDNAPNQFVDILGLAKIKKKCCCGPNDKKFDPKKSCCWKDKVIKDRECEIRIWVGHCDNPKNKTSPLKKANKAIEEHY